MTGFVDKFGVYIQYIKIVISDTSKHCDKATLEGNRTQMVETQLLLKCNIFADILDSVKNFCLSSQYKENDTILLVERMNAMKLSYQLLADKYQASPEGVFKIPRVEKLLTQSVDNENGEYFHQGKKLKNF